MSDSATTAKPQGFSARSDSSDEEDLFDAQAQTQYAYRQQSQQQPLYDYSQSEESEQEEAPRQVYQSRNEKPQNNYVKSNNKYRPTSEEETEEVEEEEPDRLATLLTKSTFNCNSKHSGYYADESLSCEVFHYCQDNQKHSWICPEGFTFHQIHLICMPPSHDNICQQSSKYHIVNDYLYKPINLQEHQSKPNVTLRYSNRYFPDNYDYDRNVDIDDDEEISRYRPQQQRQPLQVGFRSQQFSPQVQQTTSAYTQQTESQSHEQQQQQQHQYQQQTRQPVQQARYQQVPTQAPHVTQVYRRPSPPQTTTATTTTTTRRPAPVTQHRTPTFSPYISPAPYRFYTGGPQLSQPQVYRTPEEINISLQQRRPQIFVATPTPRYFDDDYLYERRK